MVSYFITENSLIPETRDFYGKCIDTFRHKGKNLQEKVVLASRKKGCRPLLAWSAAVKSHFWKASQQSEGDAAVMAVS